MSENKKANKPLPKLRPVLTQEELAKVMGAKNLQVMMEPPEQSASTSDSGAMGCPG